MRTVLKRGQALVLAALTMLLLTLMVLITLTLSWRVRDRVEAQIAADAAAYTEAVDLARAYNEIALINRTQMAMEVAALGMGSLISWSSHHYSNLVALQVSLGEILAYYVGACCPLGCICECMQIVPAARSFIAAIREWSRVRGIWDDAEKAASQQMDKTWRGAIDAYSQTSEIMMQQILKGVMRRQLAAGTIAGQANPELSAPPKGDGKNNAEINGSLYQQDEKHGFQPVQVALGTRGYDFTTMRRGGYAPIHDKLEPIAQTGNPAATVAPAFREGQGGTGFGNDRHSQTVRTARPDGAVWAEDHGGVLTVSWPAGSCSTAGAFPVVDTILAAAGRGGGRNKHQFMGRDSEPPSQRHILGDDSQRMYPNIMTFNWPEIEHPDNDFGQPKLYAFVTRDYRNIAPKPWDLRFDFQFTGTQEFGPRPEVQQQLAVGSSIVYYHRPDAWAEPPNLYNPFWRATLYAPDDDLDQWVKKAGFAPHAKAMELLIKRQNMKGTQ